MYLYEKDCAMKIKNFVLVIITALLLSGCFLFKKVPRDDNDNSIMYGVTMMLNSYQMDSLISVDNLPMLDEWLYAEFSDYETNGRIEKYTYIKELTESSELIYVATVKDTLYKVVKRMIEIKE